MLAKRTYNDHELQRLETYAASKRKPLKQLLEALDDVWVGEYERIKEFGRNWRWELGWLFN